MVLMVLCEFRLNGGSKTLYEQTTALGWIKEASVTLVHKFCWASFVIKVKLITVTYRIVH